ncbi:hypothetical protein H9L05_03570 [Hymenobacter qilianensis]|uniref:Glutamyl/glutaminyl-tRNA synthetase class Ib catalytic domain-containing protein n=1 Tax=Hymenobacter qilianensis TaxID=1385715 RepID=A0A7H0GX04_9BACT|nr:glutamate--tRNA ligase family protein [Hymenobacter qilianensis]QNP52820.1 hypothetical protein H9L05_03570 [Hymenobacter qilianensis]
MANVAFNDPVRGRLAPTPSGYLHLGNAVNFVLTWLLVRRAGGHLHLRIDDLDRARLRPAYLENIFQTIRWLGLDYDTGPRDAEEFEQAYSQQHHLAEYQAMLDDLRSKSGLVYACTCSRTSNLPPARQRCPKAGAGAVRPHLLRPAPPGACACLPRPLPSSMRGAALCRQIWQPLWATL